MLKEKKIVPIFILIILVILPFTCLSKEVDKGILWQIQEGSRLMPQTLQSGIKDSAKKELLIHEAESLSTIEKMFNEKYMITPRRINLKLLRDSLEEQVKAESLKIELRKQYLTSDELQDKYLIPADEAYFSLRKKLTRVNKQLDSISVTLKQFGYDMFKTTVEGIPLFTPVADNYVLGPGDEIQIAITGEINYNWKLDINRDGSIAIPYIGDIKLWGKTYREGKRIISEKFHEKFSNIEVSTSLGYLKSVNLFVLGEVSTPGIYDITFLSNPLTAFFQSDGIKKSGSLRKIKYISSKGTTKNIDLYKLFVKMEPLPELQSSSGDMIIVPPIEKVIGISGAVNRPGIYELNDDEQLSSLIKMAGGLLPTAGTKRIKLERITPSGEKITEDLKFENLNELEKISKTTELKNGDLVTVTEIAPYLHNYVEIKGNVNNEGSYQLKDGMRALDLIENANGLRKGTYMERAELLRFRGIETPEIIEVNLKKLLEGNPEENIKLEEWDQLKIFTRDEVEEKFFVRVDGEVENPGSFPLNPNMKVEDLLFIARPLISSHEKAELFRIDLEKGTYVQKIDITNKNDLKIELKPDDHMHINEKPAYREIGHVLLTGEFKFPGWYDIIVGTTLGELIDMAGGFTENAYLEGAILTKKSVKKLQDEAMENLIKETRMRLITEQRAIMGSISSEEDKLAQMKYIQMQEEQLEKIKEIQNPGRVIINLSDPIQLEMPLENGDELEIPRLTKTVQVIGEVYNSTGIAYEENLSLKDYLEIAGGPKPTANIREMYVVRASGKVEKGSVKIKPGDTIIVPEKVKIGISPLEALGFTVDILYKVGLTVAAFVAIIK